MRMIGMEDEEFQKKGIVTVMSTGDSDNPLQMDMFGLKNHVHEVVRAFTEALPGNQRCVHFCFPNLFSLSSYLLFSVAHFAISTLDKLMAVRVRIHKGMSDGKSMGTLLLILLLLNHRRL